MYRFLITAVLFTLACAVCLRPKYERIERMRQIERTIREVSERYAH